MSGSGSGVEETKLLKFTLMAIFWPALKRGMSRCQAFETEEVWVSFKSPRSTMSFTTAWSTNAVSICHACGLAAIQRIERSRRYRIETDEPLGEEEQAAFLADVHDRMTECAYAEPLQSFESGVEPAPTFEVPLQEVDLGIRSGEYMVLLGPTGAGKTILLRSMVGIHTPCHGSISIDGQDVTGLDPEERLVGYVPQDYALFPNMNVRRNLEYGLRARGTDKGEIQRSVDAMMDLLRIGHLASRTPLNLTGTGSRSVGAASGWIRNEAISCAVIAMLKGHVSPGASSKQAKSASTWP